MSIILKHILRNIRSKKIITILILFSVSISSALLFVTLSISGTLSGIFEKTLRNTNGNADIVVKTEFEKRNEFFDYDFQGEQWKNMTFAPEILTLGMYEYKKNISEWFNIHAISPENLNKTYNINISNILSNFDGNQIIISDRTAKQFSLNVGESILITLNNQLYDFEVVAIAQNNGLFEDEARTKTAIIPLFAAWEIFDCKDKANILNIFLNSGEDITDTISELTGVYSGLTVEEAVSEQDIENQTGSFNLTFFLIFFSSCGMSVFIIYSSFKVIITDRIGTLGTFRCLGVSKRKSNFILLLETMTYGILSGTIALILGIPLLYLISGWLVTSGDFNGITVSPVNMAITFLFAVVLSLLCSLFPIRSAYKMPIKDIVLGIFKISIKKHHVRFIVGSILITIGLIIPTIKSLSYNMIAVILSLPFIFSGIICTIPFLAEKTSALVEKLFPDSLAPKNLRKNKSFTSIVTLITIGMSVILLINNVNSLMIKATDEAFSLSNYQIEANGMPSDSELAKDIENIEGVEKADGIFIKTDIQVKGMDDLKTLYGMGKDKFESFYHYTLQTPAEESFALLQSGRNILLSQDYLDRFSLTVGDEIELMLNENTQKYKIVGIINEMLNNGNIAVISEDNFKTDLNKKNYSFIAIKTNENAEQVSANIQSGLWDQNINLTTLAAIHQETKDMNETIFIIIRLVVALSTIIGAVGIINNLTINFFERQRTLAMLRSVGMNIRSGGKMIAAEAIITGFIGSLFGFCGGYCLSCTIPSILQIFEFPAKPIQFDPVIFIIYLTAGIALCILSSLSTMRKTAKINIVEAIKYE